VQINHENYFLKIFYNEIYSNENFQTTINWCNSQGRSRLPLEAVWYPHAVLFIHFKVKKCTLVVQQHQQKLSVKADLAIYSQVIGA